MNGRTIKLLKDFYATFYYRDPEAFQRNWKQIKKSWAALPEPKRKTTSKRMRAMLARYAEATKKARKALPNYNAIVAAGKLLDEKGLPTGEIPAAAEEPQDWGQGDQTDDADPRGHSLGGA
jgi:hypothetical protein